MHAADLTRVIAAVGALAAGIVAVVLVAVLLSRTPGPVQAAPLASAAAAAPLAARRRQHPDGPRRARLAVASIAVVPGAARLGLEPLRDERLACGRARPDRLRGHGWLLERDHRRPPLGSGARRPLARV